MKTTGAFSEETHHCFIRDKILIWMFVLSFIVKGCRITPHQNNHSAFGRFQHLVWDLWSTHLLHGFTIALSCSCGRQLLCFQPINLCFWTKDLLIQITSAEIHVVTDNPMVIQVFWSFSLGIGCVFQENKLKCAKLPTNWTENLRQQVLLGDQSKFNISVLSCYICLDVVYVDIFTSLEWLFTFWSTL